MQFDSQSDLDQKGNMFADFKVSHKPKHGNTTTHTRILISLCPRVCSFHPHQASFSLVLYKSQTGAAWA